MKVLKFGGTSIGSPERMKNVAKLVTSDNESKIVVLSAISGTTNALVVIGQEWEANRANQSIELLKRLQSDYVQLCQELFQSQSSRSKGEAIVEQEFQTLFEIIETPFKSEELKPLLAGGELLSTRLFTIYLEEINISAELISALDFMLIDKDGEPALEAIRTKLNKILKSKSHIPILLTQGFICQNHLGGVDNLKRGGSDYTASLIGAAIKAKEVQIWTDIDGMHNNDPRIVPNTFPIAELSFEEAAELAYFGAKILHPSTIVPAQKFGVPVRLLNTMKPEARGTTISAHAQGEGVKSIAAKDNITAIKIKSTRMLLAYGFLKSVFEIFENYRTSIDMITTSEVAVSLTIDDDRELQPILEELGQFGTPIVDRDQTIICIVGDKVVDKKGIVKTIFTALEDVPVRMISYGGSKNNISVLVDTQLKEKALLKLNEELFSRIPA